MNCCFPVSHLVALPLLLLAQAASAQAPGNAYSPPYRPAVPSAAMPYGGYGGGFYGASTAGQGAMDGMANMISAKGDYNLSTSAAAVNMTQAQRSEIENRQLYTDAYFQMRQTNTAARKAEAGPPVTEEQLVRLAREEAPRPVSSAQVNPVSGQINWPGVLQDNAFAAQRSALEQLSAKLASTGSLSFSDQMMARETIEAVFGQLKAHIDAVPPQMYVASKSFLQSMMYSLAHTGLD